MHFNEPAPALLAAGPPAVARPLLSPHRMARALRSAAVRGPAVAQALAVEGLYTASAASRWIGGFSAEQVALPSRQLHEEVVVLVHGIGSNKSHFAPLERHLLNRGYRVYAVNYSWLFGGLEDCGAHVAGDIVAGLEHTGADRVHLIGHSLGGVAARQALRDARVARAVASVTTLGSPHSGTYLAHLADLVPAPIPGIGRLVDDLRRGAPMLTDLPRPSDFPAVTHLAIAGSLDWIVPAGAATFEPGPNVTNVTVRCGHIAMPVIEPVRELVTRTLAEAAAAYTGAAAA